MNEESEARMERKIIVIMLTLVVVAIVVIGIVMVAAVGIKKTGGFTGLFDDLEYSGDLTFRQPLEIPDSWDEGDVKTVSDTIVDMFYDKETVEQTTVYVTTLYFVYIGDKWNDPDEGNRFSIPIADEDEIDWKEVIHGLFSIRVSSATNLFATYDIGDVITLETTIADAGGTLAFGEWIVADTL
ncbi:MAG: hypothetical protein OEM29_09280 [Thermoplasmata archaeon]|nr:hypothetical protein [Thermoplasmata archaeon]